MIKPENIFDWSAKNYEKTEEVRFRLCTIRTIENAMKYLNANDIVLDLGCATGTKAIELSGKVKSVVGIDISAKMVELAQKKVIERNLKNVEFIKTTIFDESVTVLVSGQDEEFMVKSTNSASVNALSELEKGIFAALETYSNVHRGSGHNSMVTTHLYEQARDIVLEYLNLSKNKYTVIFCTPRRAAILKSQLTPGSYHIVSSQDIGLLIGIRAIAVKKNALPKGIAFQTGGGTAKLISKNWVIWDDAPEKFEAGTPPIINVIAFARALCLIRQNKGIDFSGLAFEKKSIKELLFEDELDKYSGKELLCRLRQTLIGRGVCVPTAHGLSSFINLDNAASTPTFEPIWNVFRNALRQASSMQHEIIEEVKAICADFLNVPLKGYDIIFTSNTTEAINLVSENMSFESDANIEPVIVNTIMEHSSNDLPWRMVPGCSLISLFVDDEGFIDLKELEAILSSYNVQHQYERKRIRLVAVNGASNVLGVCNNIEEITRIVHKYKARILVDAAQLIAHREIDIQNCGIDYLVFSSHKAYAPFGSGALIARKGLLHFDGLQMALIQSSGEENLAGIASLGKALVLLKRIGMDVIYQEEQSLTKLTLQGMSKIKKLQVYGIKDHGSTSFKNKIGVIVFSIGNIMPYKIARELAFRNGIGTRYGCHCSHIIVKHILHVGPFLERFQWLIQVFFPKLRLPGVIRVSFGLENTTEDVERLINGLNTISQNMKPSSEVPFSNKVQTTNIPEAKVKTLIKEFIKSRSEKVYKFIAN